MMTKFCSGNEERPSRYWLKEKEMRYTISGRNEEALELSLNDYAWTMDKVEGRTTMLTEVDTGISYIRVHGEVEKGQTLKIRCKRISYKPKFFVRSCGRQINILLQPYF